MSGKSSKRSKKRPAAEEAVSELRLRIRQAGRGLLEDLLEKHITTGAALSIDDLGKPRQKLPAGHVAKSAKLTVDTSIGPYFDRLSRATLVSIFQQLPTLDAFSTLSCTAKGLLALRKEPLIFEKFDLTAHQQYGAPQISLKGFGSMRLIPHSQTTSLRMRLNKPHTPNHLKIFLRSMQFSQLRTLSLSGEKISDAVLRDLIKPVCGKLESITLYGNVRAKDEGLAVVIKESPNLKELRIHAKGLQRIAARIPGLARLARGEGCASLIHTIRVNSPDFSNEISIENVHDLFSMATGLPELEVLCPGTLLIQSVPQWPPTAPTFDRLRVYHQPNLMLPGWPKYLWWLTGRETKSEDLDEVAESTLIKSFVNTLLRAAPNLCVLSLATRAVADCYSLKQMQGGVRPRPGPFITHEVFDGVSSEQLRILQLKGFRFSSMAISHQVVSLTAPVFSGLNAPRLSTIRILERDEVKVDRGEVSPKPFMAELPDFKEGVAETAKLLQEQFSGAEVNESRSNSGRPKALQSLWDADYLIRHLARDCVEPPPPATAATAGGGSSSSSSSSSSSG